MLIGFVSLGPSRELLYWRIRGVFAAYSKESAKFQSNRCRRCALFLSEYSLSAILGSAHFQRVVNTQLVRGDVKIQVDATGTVCSRLQKVAILLFPFRPISTYCFNTILYAYFNE